MTNADLTVRVLSGIAAAMSLVALGMLARDFSKPRQKTLASIVSPIAFSIGILTYSIGRMFSHSTGPDASITMVAGMLIGSGCLGLVLERRKSRKLSPRA